jgi:hypothetical protein
MLENGLEKYFIIINIRAFKMFASLHSKVHLYHNKSVKVTPFDINKHCLNGEPKMNSASSLQAFLFLLNNRSRMFQAE